jgi:hypothetical protein
MTKPIDVRSFLLGVAAGALVVVTACGGAR